MAMVSSFAQSTAGQPAAGQDGADAATTTREKRPPRVPVVAVGSVIAWNVPFAERPTGPQTLDIYAPPGAKDAPS